MHISEIYFNAYIRNIRLSYDIIDLYIYFDIYKRDLTLH